MTQTDLFAEPLLAGVEYRPDFISRDEEAALIAQLNAMELAPFRFQGWTGNRKTQSFGWSYDFDDASFSPTEPIPEWLEPLRDKAAAFAGVAPDEIAHALLARYDPGARPGGMAVTDFFSAVRRLASNPRARVIDLTEWDPPLDTTDLSALTAARWVAECLAGYEAR